MRRMMFIAAAVALLGGALSVDVATGQGGRTAVKATGWGSLTGKVTFAGNKLPDVVDLTPKMQVHGDAKCCLMGKADEKTDQTWVVDKKTKGVANIAVYLRPTDPKKEYLPVDKKDQTRTDTVTVDQPHCQFIPHMVATFPSYFDGTKQVPTGQKFMVKNSATVPHNIRAVGNPLSNPGFNVTLPPGASQEAKLKPQPLPVLLNCDIHNWMTAKAFVFEHPYFAITKEDGSYKIDRVPAGAEVVIMGWHEATGYVLGKDGKATTLKDGENVFDFTISAK